MIKNNARWSLQTMWIGVALVAIAGCDGSVDHPASRPVSLGAHVIVRSGTVVADASMPSAAQITGATQQTLIELRHFDAYEQYRGRFDVCQDGVRRIPVPHSGGWRKTVSRSSNGEAEAFSICFRSGGFDK